MRLSNPEGTFAGWVEAAEAPALLEAGSASRRLRVAALEMHASTLSRGASIPTPRRPILATRPRPQFRKAWEPEDWPEQWERAYHIRNANDKNEVISFGFFNGTLGELRQLRDESGREDERQRRMAELVESTGADGIYELIEEVRPPGAV